MRTGIAAILTATTLTTGTLLGAPAVRAHATDYPVSNFDVTLGNTYTRGTITWYNRSVTVAGEHKSVDTASCRGTTAFTLDSADHELGRGYSPGIVCGTSQDFIFDVPADVSGGAAVVRVCLDDGSVDSFLLCKRYGH